MKIKPCKEFYFRVRDADLDFNKIFSSKENVTRNNPNLKFFAGEWIKVKTNDYISHIVRPAETIGDISKKYDKPKAQILSENNLQSEKLYIGQLIKIYEKSHV